MAKKKKKKKKRAFLPNLIPSTRRMRELKERVEPKIKGGDPSAEDIRNAVLINAAQPTKLLFRGANSALKRRKKKNGKK